MHLTLEGLHVVNLVLRRPAHRERCQNLRRGRPDALVNILAVGNLILPRSQLRLNVIERRLRLSQQSLQSRYLDQRIRPSLIPAITDAKRDQRLKIRHIPCMSCFCHN